jgi:hypothetical protein
MIITWCIRGRGIFVCGRKCGVWKKEEDLRKKPWMDLEIRKFGGKRKMKREKNDDAVVSVIGKTTEPLRFI